MKKNYSIKVSLRNNPYEVIIGKNILRKSKNKIFSTIKDAKKIFIITDTVIKRLHLRKVIKDLLKIRKPIYSKANFIVKTNEKPIKICNKILICIKNLI